jgi:glycosyltransferase involved in cell wall biosynthesis
MSERRQLRILFVANDGEYLIRNYGHIIRSAELSGFTVAIAAPALSKGTTTHWFPLPLYRRSMNPWRELKTILALRGIYREFQPTIVHHFTIKPVLYGTFAARLASVPAVANSVTGLGYLFLRGRVLSQLGKILYRTFLRHQRMTFLFQNPSDRAEFKRIVPLEDHRLYLIDGAGIDPEFHTPTPVPPGPLKVLYAGRFLREKGLGELLQAARALAADSATAPIQIYLCGDVDLGNRGSFTAAEVDEWRTIPSVTVLPARPDIRELLRSCHLVCLPSYREGLSRFLIEALATGRAIVTTDTPGCRELCRDGENGILVKPREVSDLTNALRIFREDPELATRYGAASRSRFEAGRFGFRNVSAVVLAMYDDLLQGLPL